jgi:4-hydroxy-tetrahydrodipicolinate synthase
MRDEEFIVGIKDSSGRAENVRRFADARGAREWTLLIGDDRLLHTGMAAGWDGGISGVACCCPELLVALAASCRRGDTAESLRLQQLVDEFVAKLAAFPTPWGIRIALAARGMPTGPLPLPLTRERERQIAEFQAWVGPWLEGG